MTRSRTRPAVSTGQPLRAVIYVRLSSYRGDADPSTSPERQEAACRAYCAAKGWTVVEVVSDLDVSGSEKGLRLKRPGLDKIRSLWGAVDIVIFAKLDRLARNVIDFRAFADEAEENDAALVSVNESLDLTTPGGKFVATILAAFAEMEAATITARTLDGQEAARELGRYLGGPRPFGYRTAPHPSGKGKILVPFAEEAELVRELARRALAGETIYHLSKDLNARDVPVPSRASGKRQDATWYQSSVSRLLTSASVVGRVKHGDDYLRDANGEPRQMWEPLLNLDDWYRIRALFLPNQDAPRPVRKRADWLLSGLVRCALCGGPCNAGQGGTGNRRYRCSALGSAGKCPGVTINAEALEAHIEAEALRRSEACPHSASLSSRQTTDAAPILRHRLQPLRNR